MCVGRIRESTSTSSGVASEGLHSQTSAGYETLGLPHLILLQCYADIPVRSEISSLVYPRFS